VPSVSVDPESISILMIAEAAPADPADYFFARGKPQFEQTTVLAFQDAGADVSTSRDILRLGVYLSTAVKCAKTTYAIRNETIDRCSVLLEEELALFPKARAILLMGDVAIRALNTIARRQGQPRVIPAGSTYKLREREYSFQGRRVFPSYLQAGPSFFIEKSKRRMIAEDIRGALHLVGA
jgi:uracil-DNA glycosylase